MSTKKELTAFIIKQDKIIDTLYALLRREYEQGEDILQHTIATYGISPSGPPFLAVDLDCPLVYAMGETQEEAQNATISKARELLGIEVNEGMGDVVIPEYLPEDF